MTRPIAAALRRRLRHHSTMEGEALEQRTLFDWAAILTPQHPELALLFAIPNGGWRHKRTAAHLKATGTKPGVPDLCLPVPRGPYHGLWIELKRRDGTPSSVGPAQRWWREQLTAQGYLATVAFGWDEARRDIENYLKLPTLTSYAQV